MIENPRILISNDDGIDAPGLKCLHDIARQLSDDVWVVAPDANQSGAGHRFTLGTELHYTQKSDRVFSLNGTPADCVVAGCTDILKDKAPDVVLAGINHGQNMGDIIHCSGTAAAAREGALQGALGIALSQGVDYEKGLDVEWDVSCAFAMDLLRQLFEAADLGGARNRDIYYNVNFPQCALSDVSGVRVVPIQRFERSAFRYFPSKNEGRFFISIPETPVPMEPDHDFCTLQKDKAISVTPMTLQHSDRNQIERLQGRFSIRQDTD